MTFQLPRECPSCAANIILVAVNEWWVERDGVVAQEAWCMCLDCGRAWVQIECDNGEIYHQGPWPKTGN